MCFVDFASAFDSVDRDSLWRIMAADGMHPKLLMMIKACNTSTKIKFRVSGSDSTSLRSAPAFDKDVLSPLPSSIT